MRKLNFKYIVAFAALGFFASCEPENATTDARVVKPVVTAAVTTYTIAEGATATVNLTVDTRYYRSMDFKLELVGGTGSFGDFTCSGTETVVDDGWGVIGHKISFPAYASTASFTITPTVDFLPEGAEKLIFRLYPMGNSNGLVATASELITVNVNNTTSTDVKAELKWATTYNAHGNLEDIMYAGVDGTSHSLEAYDFDLLVFGPTNIFTGATGAASTETGPTGFTPRGVTAVVGTGYKPTTFLGLKPILTVGKPGVWVKEMDLSGIWNSNTGPSAVAGNDASAYVGKVTKTGTTYTLFDADDAQLATGRAAGKVMPKVARNK